MKELFTCASCGDCAVKLGFGFTFPDTYICTQRGDEVEPDDGCTRGCEGVPMQAIEAIEEIVNAAKLDTAECIEIRQNNIEQVEKALLRAYKTGLEEIGLVAEGYAKATCPVDTGRLRNSVTHLLKGYDCFIGTNVEYAPYVEEGTSRMKGKHFLRKAATGHGDTYRAILEKHLRGGA